ncbi:MAG TPA: cupin domain-containing protein [Kofleriaceae bacterium]|nr:cupin domain-containing protein [Kofleriaceae bacterium]
MDDINVKAIEDIAPYSGEHAIPGIRFRPARDALGVSGFGMSVIEMEPGNTGYPAHDHGDDGHEEVYVVLRGAAVLVTDAGERIVREGELVAVPGRIARKFVTRDQGVTLLALGGTPGEAYKPAMGRPAKL